VSDLLNNVYRGSITKYNKISDKLENSGKTDHLKANINYRMSVISPGSPDPDDDDVQDEIIHEMRIKIRRVETIARRLTLGSTHSFLDEQDEDILD